MARARNIKPGFFTNDLLAEIHPFGRLLFVGLWTIADRDGKLEDRPKKIKAEILPFDNCDVEKQLRELTERGFINRYVVGNVKIIQIINWKKHQNPHVKEAESLLPAPDEHGASIGRIPDGTQPLPERAGLIPDSLNLIPDSMGTDVPTRQQKPKREKFIKPTITEVIAYCRERGDKVDPAKWMDHYTANGWKVGKNPMVDWQAAIRGWEKPKDGTQTPGRDDRSRAQRHSDALRDIAQASIERERAENGGAEPDNPCALDIRAVR